MTGIQIMTILRAKKTWMITTKKKMKMKEQMMSICIMKRSKSTGKERPQLIQRGTFILTISSPSKYYWNNRYLTLISISAGQLSTKSLLLNYKEAIQKAIGPRKRTWCWLTQWRKMVAKTGRKLLRPYLAAQMSSAYIDGKRCWILALLKDLGPKRKTD